MQKIRNRFSCRFSWLRFWASGTFCQRSFVPPARAAHSALTPILACPCLGHRHDTKRRSIGSMTFRTIAHMTPVRLVVWTHSDPCKSHKYCCTCRLLPERHMRSREATRAAGARPVSLSTQACVKHFADRLCIKCCYRHAMARFTAVVELHVVLRSISKIHLFELQHAVSAYGASGIFKWSCRKPRHAKLTLRACE
jgi:hypothetical protein